MARVRFVLLFAIGFLTLVPINAWAQESGKIYSPVRYRNQRVNFCLNFQTGLSTTNGEPCDLRYGALGIAYDFDWLEASAARGSRSVFKDLGLKNWGDSFEVPVIAALPKLKPGEQRTISVDTSGRTGEKGKPGREGAPGVNGSGGPPAPPVSGSVIFSTDLPDGPKEAPVAQKPTSPPKLDPIFVKAIVGHMYVARIVDDNSDYYALFRVDAIEDHVCSISWKLIPTPNN